MEVHAPEHPIHTWRDFFTHIATIVVGLLIAIGLEQSVEWLHHKHLLHTAEHNLHAERELNRGILARDERQLDATQQRLERTLLLVTHLRAHQADAAPFDTHWEFDSPQSAAWDTARLTSATALLPYEDAEALSSVYGQQQVVIDASKLYVQDIYRIRSPLQDGSQLTSLSPAELDEITAHIHTALGDLHQLRDLCRSLDNVYAHNPL